MKPKRLLDTEGFQLTIKRLCHQLIENHSDFSRSILIGIQPRGIYLSRRIKHFITSHLKIPEIVSGELDITFFRDDFRRRQEPLVPNTTNIDFIVEHKKVVLIDDVLFTGRTARAAMEALLSFGRPEKVELLVLIDRRFSRQLPIEPNYTGKHVDTLSSEKIKVKWLEQDSEDEVLLIKPD